MYLLHVGDEPIYDKLNDLPPFEIPPNKPFLIQDDWVAARVLEHKNMEGLVQVPFETNEDGMPVYDLKEAKKLAREKLDKCETELVQRYVKIQQNDRISHGKPPMPPSAKIRKIIHDRNIDIAAMGINLSGSGFSLPTKADTSEEVDKLRDQLTDTQKTVAQVMKQNEELIKQLNKAYAPPKGKD